MKQTAVEWLFLMINNPNKDQKFANKLLDKAKEMEKQQIIDAYRISTIESSVPREFKKYNSAEQYYKEKFNN